MSRVKYLSPRTAGRGIIFGLLTLASTLFAQQWNTLTPLPDDYVGQSLVYASNYLYQAGGGSEDDGVLSGTNVFRAQVYSNGTIGSWNSVTPLPETDLYGAGISANGFLYVLGGQTYDPVDGIILTSNVYYAKINPDASLGSWQTANPLPYCIQFLSASVWNGQIYVIGGFGGTNEYGNDAEIRNTVYSAKIQANGSLSPWTQQLPMPVAIYTHAEAANGYLYVLGGAVNGGSTIVNTVYYSKINADGTLAGWNQTVPLPQPESNFGAIVANGFIFSIGGFNGNVQTSSVYVAPVNGDGSIISWSSGTSLPQPLYLFAVAASGTYIFLTGGASNASNQNSVYSMALPTPPPAPTLTKSNLVNGTFNLRLSSSSTNTGFGLLASPDLINWTNIAWGFTGTNGLLTFTDTNAAQFPKRFYRAYWPLP